jgi:hypothetical protein
MACIWKHFNWCIKVILNPPLQFLHILTHSQCSFLTVCDGHLHLTFLIRQLPAIISDIRISVQIVIDDYLSKSVFILSCSSKSSILAVAFLNLSLAISACSNCCVALASCSLKFLTSPVLISTTSCKL